VEVQPGKLKATMRRVEMKDGMAKWTEPDSVTISCPRQQDYQAPRGRLERLIDIMML
jgi:hypothetical protein